jgi:hypothetical protein
MCHTLCLTGCFIFQHDEHCISNSIVHSHLHSVNCRVLKAPFKEMYPEAGVVVQVVECLPIKHETLNSNPLLPQKRKKAWNTSPKLGGLPAIRGSHCCLYLLNIFEDRHSVKMLKYCSSHSSLCQSGLGHHLLQLPNLMLSKEISSSQSSWSDHLKA